MCSLINLGEVLTINVPVRPCEERVSTYFCVWREIGTFSVEFGRHPSLRLFLQSANMQDDSGDQDGPNTGVVVWCSSCFAIERWAKRLCGNERAEV